MFKAYYSCSDPNVIQDVESALRCAMQLKMNASSLNVFLYGYDLSNIEAGADGVTGLLIKGDQFSYTIGVNTLTGGLSTRRKLSFANKDNCVLIALFSDETQLKFLEDYENVISIIVVPDYYNNCANNWLKLHAAKDLTTGNYIVQPTPIPDMAKRAIGKLINESKLFLNLGNFLHSLPYIKRQANVLAKNGIKVSYEGLFQNCIERGLDHTVSRKIAETFAQAQIRLHKDSGNTNYSAVWDELQDKPELARETV